jgi:hypothetical protein
MISKLLRHPEISDVRKGAIAKIGGVASCNLAQCDKPIFHLERACFEILGVMAT